MSALVRARGQIMFLMGLVLASGLVFWLNRQESVPVSDIEPAPRLIHTPPAQARVAWSYFERNRNASTGLVNAFDRSGWTTAADAGHTLKAVAAAHRIGLINGREMYEQMALILETLSHLDPRSAATRITTADGKPAPGSAPSPDALVSALELIAWSYPANSGAARRELDRWRGVRHVRSADSQSPSDAEKNAALLIRAAMARKGDH